MIENSHSIASASVDGQIHVWRVELTNGLKTDGGSSSSRRQGGVSPANDLGSQSRSSDVSVRGLSVVRTLDPSDGPVVALQYLSTDIASLIAYTTQKGGLGGWDLRASKEAFHYVIRPEFGSPTCMVLPSSTDIGGGNGHWLIVGTSRGYVIMWDMRYGVINGAWRYSKGGPIRKIIYCQSNPVSTKPSATTASTTSASTFSSSSSLPEDEEETYDKIDMYIDINKRMNKGQNDERVWGAGEGGYLMIAAGDNESTVWNLPIPEDGTCVRTFKAVSVSNIREKSTGAPRLLSIPLPSHALAPIQGAMHSLSNPSIPSTTSSIRALLSHLSRSTTGVSYLITGGSDSIIRYWDFSSPSRCCVLSGENPYIVISIEIYLYTCHYCDYHHYF